MKKISLNDIDKSRNNLNIVFKGFVDKIMINDDESIMSIIDYKTGNDDISLKYLKYGLNIQLPIYLYLESNTLEEELQKSILNSKFLISCFALIFILTPILDKLMLNSSEISISDTSVFVLKIVNLVLGFFTI